MDDATLHRRLDSIERRQSLILGLIVGAYAIGCTWILVEIVPAITLWTVAVFGGVVLFLAIVAGIYRRRTAMA